MVIIEVDSVRRTCFVVINGDDPNLERVLWD